VKLNEKGLIETGAPAAEYPIWIVLDVASAEVSVVPEIVPMAYPSKVIVPPEVPVAAAYRHVKVAYPPELIVPDDGEHEPDEVTDAVPVGYPSTGFMTSWTPVAVNGELLYTVPLTVISPPLRTDCEAQTVVHTAESETSNDGVP
jgi:hypothetical protein